MEAGFSLYHDYMLSRPTYSRTHVLELVGSNWSQGNCGRHAEDREFFGSGEEVPTCKKANPRSPFLGARGVGMAHYMLPAPNSPQDFFVVFDPLPERFRGTPPHPSACINQEKKREPFPLLQPRKGGV